MTENTDDLIQESKALSPIAERGVIAARKDPSLSIKDLAQAIVDEPPLYWGGKDLIPFPKVPNAVVLTDEDKVALSAFPTVFGKVAPTERRTLTGDEIHAAYLEHEVLSKIETLIASRRDNLKEYVKHHLDVDAEERNAAIPQPVVDKETGEVTVEASPRDSAGHYVLGSKGKPERLPIPDTNLEWSREARAGLTSVSGSRLTELYEAGEISKEDYYAFTREQRVFDEEKTRKSLAKNPALFDLLARITQRSGVGSAMFIRKPQK